MLPQSAALEERDAVTARERHETVPLLAGKPPKLPSHTVEGSGPDGPVTGPVRDERKQVGIFVDQESNLLKGGSGTRGVPCTPRSPSPA